MQNYIAELPSILQETTLSPGLTRLTIEAKRIRPEILPYPFEELVNAYLSYLPLSQNLVHLELKAEGIGPSRGVSFVHWTPTDLLLADEGRFPNLKTMHLVFQETFWHLSEIMKTVIKDRLPARGVEMAQAIRNVFERSEGRGLCIEVGWENHPENP
jgi:hypothetical protein